MSDARTTAISDDTRFATAYGAALLLAKMTMAVSGYRLDAKASGHHKTAFEALSVAIGPTASPLADYFDVCRRKRNEIDYDRASVASTADVDEILKRVDEFERLVENWISANSPTFAK